MHNIEQRYTTWHNLAQHGKTSYNMAKYSTTWHNIGQHVIK